MEVEAERSKVMAEDADRRKFMVTEAEQGERR